MMTTTPTYLLGALAVVCYAACLLLHPHRAAYRAGWQFVRAWPWTWVVLGLATAHHGWWQVRAEALSYGWLQEFNPAFASEFLPTVARHAGQSVAAALVMPVELEPLSVALALAVLLNLSDLGRALRRGCQTAFPQGGRWVWWLLMLSAVANIAWLALGMSHWGSEHHVELERLRVIGLLWGGSTVAFALAWLVRLAETHLNAPEEILQIQWPGSASGRIPRLWPIVLGSALAQGWPAPVDERWAWALRLCGWALAAAAGCLPLLLVHWRGDWTWRTVFTLAARRWALLWGPFLLWLAMAYTHFFLVHLAHQGIASGLPVASVWRLGWDTLCALLQAALLVWLLVAWIAQQPKFQMGKG